MSLNKDYAPLKRKRHRRRVPRLQGSGDELVAQVLEMLTPVQEAIVRTAGWEALPFRFWVGHVRPRDIDPEAGETEIRAVLLKLPQAAAQVREEVRRTEDVRVNPRYVNRAYKYRETVTDVPVRDGAVAAVLAFHLPPEVLERDVLWSWPTDEAAALERAGIHLVMLRGEDYRVLRRAWFRHERVVSHHG